MTTNTAERLDLNTIRDRAAAAAAAAQALRDRASAGDPTLDAAGLAAAEADERLTRLQLHAAEDRATAQREAEAVAQLIRDRAAMQEAWATAHAPAADAEVRALMAAAVDAAGVYLRAAGARRRELEDLTDRARSLGFRVDNPQLPNPLPVLGRAILTEAHQAGISTAVNDNGWGAWNG